MPPDDTRQPLDPGKDHSVRKIDTSRILRMDKVGVECEKEHGQGSLLRLAGGFREGIDSISTGSLGLDIATGIGGVPQGRIIELYGPESAGKTTLALHVVANAQKKGGATYFIDAEHALDLNYAEKLGVNIDYCMVSQPDCGEQALDIAETVSKMSQSGDVIVIDSVAALVPRKEIEGDMGDSHMGLQARLMSQALRKLTGVSKKNGVTIIFINQLRLKIGVVFGNPETTPGGNALKFYASMRLDIRRKGGVQSGSGEQVANATRVKIVKSKVSPPFRYADFEIFFGQGIDREKELIMIGADEKYVVIEKAGSWFSYNGDRLGQGVAKAAELLKNNPEIAQEIEKKILEIAYAT